MEGLHVRPVIARGEGAGTRADALAPCDSFVVQRMHDRNAVRQVLALATLHGAEL